MSDEAYSPLAEMIRAGYGTDAVGLDDEALSSRITEEGEKARAEHTARGGKPKPPEKQTVDAQVDVDPSLIPSELQRPVETKFVEGTNDFLPQDAYWGNLVAMERDYGPGTAEHDYVMKVLEVSWPEIKEQLEELPAAERSKALHDAIIELVGEAKRNGWIKKIV